MIDDSNKTWLKYSHTRTCKLVRNDLGLYNTLRASQRGLRGFCNIKSGPAGKIFAPFLIFFT